MKSEEHEHAYDLFWHALNYRGASSENAQACYEELEECVMRLIGKSVQDFAALGQHDIGEKVH